MVHVYMSMHVYDMHIYGYMRMNRDLGGNFWLASTSWKGGGKKEVKKVN